MFRTTYQRGLVSVLFSGGSRPLAVWGSSVRNGHVRRIVDEDTRSLVLELSGTNVATTFIFSPPLPRDTLALRLPFFAMVVKNLKRYFTFEIQILDDKDMRRRFRVSNFKSCTRVHPFSCHMPIGLNPGWNLVQFNLADFVRRAYGTTYIETQRIQVHANCRLRRIYFSDRIYSEDELPADYKLYAPCQRPRRLPGRRKPPTYAPTEEPALSASEQKMATAHMVTTPQPVPHQIQITLPYHSSLAFSVPPPSDADTVISQPPDVETPRSDATETIITLDESSVQPPAPDMFGAQSVEPIAQPVAADESTAIDEASVDESEQEETTAEAIPPGEPSPGPAYTYQQVAEPTSPD